MAKHATVDQVAGHNVLPIPNLIVPLAISFFTFEFVHVLVDVYLGKILALDLLDFAVFTMFFPTLVAGPIKRFESFAPQVRSNRDTVRADVSAQRLSHRHRFGQENDHRGLDGAVRSAAPDAERHIRASGLLGRDVCLCRQNPL